MSRRFVQQSDGSLVEVKKEASVTFAPAVHSDIPAYYSHATGKMIEGRAQRREDLNVSGCRPFEGREAEEREAARGRAYAEEARDKAVQRALEKVLPHMPKEVRGALLHGDVSDDYNEKSLRGRR